MKQVVVFGRYYRICILAEPVAYLDLVGKDHLQKLGFSCWLSAHFFYLSLFSRYPAFVFLYPFSAVALHPLKVVHIYGRLVVFGPEQFKGLLFGGSEFIGT